MYLKISNLNKTIKNAVILENINLYFESGKIYGIQGKNGCGKTMLIRAITGLISVTSGEIDIDGQILHKDIEFPQSVGALIENPAFLPAFTGLRNLEMLSDFSGKSNKEEISKILESVGLNPEDKRVYRKYSLGMKQKLGIANALLDNPDLIILDEPFNALDAESTENIHNLLTAKRDEGKLIILVCHDLTELASISDVIIKMENGAVIDEK